MSNDAPRASESLSAYASAATQEEKVSASKIELHLKERQARGEPAGFDAWLAESPDLLPLAGDALP